VITVLLVDDHPLVRSGLVGLVASTTDLTVVGEVPGGADAVRFVQDAAAKQAPPDVVLMDLSMPGMDGVEATRQVLAAAPTVRVVVLTSFHDRDRVLEALAAGAVGYLLKDSEPVEVLAAIRAAAQGHAPLDPRVAGVLLPTAPGAENKQKPADPGLSARESEVLELLATGMSNRQIGRSLGIAERTVKVHVGNVFRRIGVADRTSAALWFRDHRQAKRPAP